MVPGLLILILCVLPWLPGCLVLRARTPQPQVCAQGCAFASVQAAINAARPGATILLGRGRYRERIDFHGKGLTVRSLDPEDPETVAATILDGDGGGSAVTFTSGEGRDAVLEGVTVTNGSGSGSADQTWGGGIRIVRSSPVIRSCVVKGNRATMGGGICVSSVSRGGAEPLIEHCRIEENTAETDGGGFFGDGGEIRGCRIARNVTNYSGGGGFCIGKVRIEDCAFEGNSAVSNGGGLYLEGQETGDRVADCTVSGNRAGGYGGGLAIKEGSPQVVNFLLVRNNASSGGGVAVFGRWGKPRIINATVTANEAANGGGLFATSTHPVATNTILWGNHSSGGSPEVGLLRATLAADHCDIRGGWEGPGVIDRDPLFSGRGPWPYALTAGSPCIDSGTEEGAPRRDLRGISRPQPGRSGDPARMDMGAFEFTPEDRPRD